MRTFNLYSVFLLAAILNYCGCGHSGNTHISLDSAWKFKTGDEIAYAGQYDDTKWRNAHLSDSWDSLEHAHYEGFAWYRIKAFIPSALKENTRSDSLAIYLGHIGDCDQVFINGFIIGENNINVHQAHRTDSDFTNKAIPGIRRYVLSVKDHRIFWGKENLLALRVFSNNGRAAFDDNPYIGIVSPADGVTFNRDVFYKPDTINVLDTILVLKNATPIPLSGSVIIRCIDRATRRELVKTKVALTVKAKSSIKLPVSLPDDENGTKVYLTFKDDHCGLISRDSLNLPFILNR
jgi:hypothetical protein